jgi:hypothetical protein
MALAGDLERVETALGGMESCGTKSSLPRLGVRAFAAYEEREFFG